MHSRAAGSAERDDAVSWLGLPRLDVVSSTDDSESDDGDEEDEDEDEDPDVKSVLPTVVRFDPSPIIRQPAGRMRPAREAPPSGAASPFPSLAAQDRQENAAGGKASLRPWGRPPSKYDQVYSEDDIVMQNEESVAWRKSAPPPPSGESSGQILQEARKRYEREWAMELSDIEAQRKSVADVSGSGSVAVGTATVDDMALREHPQAAGKAGKVRPWFITKKGKRALPRGSVAQYKLLGRPPARILKKKKEVDIAKAFGKRDVKGRKANLGSGLTYQEAKEHWIAWAQRNKQNRRAGRVYEADSPRKEDVDAAWERKEARRQQRRRPRQQGSRNLPQSNIGDEA
eukprot:CAMPEP_0178411590 /NCGR_PEP_ID=MMETSP0689_2-20121128/21570_1 /TAXON_ID=160604 /ORGANISM="Amphidinium massartii, Strain CS-259" /LENGTH=342 /DNA_ID=CAMNT_0020032795 /DNA_START=1 /DNA_END=1029 /DNA_ORIENTATION=+